MTDGHDRHHDKPTDAESTLPSDSPASADGETNDTSADDGTIDASADATHSDTTDDDDASPTDTTESAASEPNLSDGDEDTTVTERNDPITDPASVLASDPIPSADRSLDDLGLADADWSRDRSTASSDLDFDPDPDPDGADGSEGLFDDLLSGDPIFDNKEVLRPSYTPHELPHRNDQINQMATILVSALRGDTPSNILIYGKTGTGKTASAKYVSQELESTSEKYDVPCEVEYINCEVTDTQYRVLAQLANKFIEKNVALIESRIDALETVREELAAGGPDTTAAVSDTDDTTVSIPDAETDAEAAPEGSLPVVTEQYTSVDAVDERIEALEADAEEMEPVPMTGWPTDRVYSTFFEAVDYNERVVVIMLDEIDKLVEKSGDDTLYNLSRMNNELANSRISIMGISNDLKFTDFLDPRVKSSLGEEEIVFPPYDATQLGDILQHRAEVAFKPDALTGDVIPLCSAFAAQEHGDARRALDLLRTAGELAERSQADIVEEEHVRQAQDKIELDRVVEVVRTLPTQSKIVLFSIILLEQNGVHNINTGEVFNIYKRLCEEIDADVLTQRRVTDLISELDMLGIVNAVVVSKGRYGRTKEMSLSVPLAETEAVLLSDSRLGNIDDVQPFVQARFDN